MSCRRTDVEIVSVYFYGGYCISNNFEYVLLLTALCLLFFQVQNVLALSIEVLLEIQIKLERLAARLRIDYDRLFVNL